MNFFDFLLGRKKNVTPDAEALIETPAVPETLFVEPQAPKPEEKTAKVYTRPAAIRDFLERNFFQMGFDDALVQPTVQRRDSRLASIGAGFRQVLQAVQQQLLAEMDAVSLQQETVKGIDAVLDAKLILKMKSLHRMMAQVVNQSELSVDFEGWLAPAAADYRDGFLAGTKRYEEETRLLGGLDALV